MIEWALLGVVLGAIGSETLRAKRPDLVDKVQRAAKNVADSICSRESCQEQETDQEEDARRD